MSLSELNISPLPALPNDISLAIREIKKNGKKLTVKYIQHDGDVVQLLDENFVTLQTVTPKDQHQPAP